MVFLKTPCNLSFVNNHLLLDRELFSSHNIDSTEAQIGKTVHSLGMLSVAW